MATSATAATSASDTLSSLASALTSKKSHRITLPRQSYPLDSPQGSREDLLNLYAEVHPSEDARTKMFLRSTPGLVEGPSFGAGPVRATEGLRSVLYAVSGTQAYRLTTAGGPIALGAVASALPNDLVTIAVGPNQVVFCTPPYAYVCNHTDASLTQITSDVFVHGVSSVAYLDGYFIFAELDSGIVRFSKLTDAGDFDAFAFASTEAMPDIVVRVIAHRGVLVIFGNDSIEFWQDVGATPVPFQRISGGVVYGGTISPATIASFNNTLGWLGRDLLVYQLASGFRAERISHYALEHDLLSYGDIRNARGCSINQDGHWCYVLTFPTPSKTWAYDAATQLWHRRTSPGGAGRWRANCAAHFGQTPMVGDYASGKLFFVSPETDTDDGVQIQRMAIFPPLNYEARRLFMSRLEIEMETGSLHTPDFVQLDWSDDGGANYSPVRTLNPARNTGDFRRRVYTTRLGSFRTRHLRLQALGAMTIYAADADMTAGSV